VNSFLVVYMYQVSTSHRLYLIKMVFLIKAFEVTFWIDVKLRTAKVFVKNVCINQERQRFSKRSDMTAQSKRTCRLEL
jgi:hypothetical protein